MTTWRLPELPLPEGKTAADFRIPDRLNLGLSALGFGTALALLWLGSLRPGFLWALAVGVLFSYAMLFVYALIHQGQHDCLHSRPRMNYVTGALLSLLFPAPFTLIRTTHQGHHLRNRTDYEMFDLYYPTDNRFLKYAQFYSILIGLFWPLIPIGGLLAAMAPGLFRSRVFRQGRNTGYLLGDIHSEQIGAIRIEMLLMVALFAALFPLLHLRWMNTLVLYGCFAINWSTRQYVSHAFTPRDILDGAFNLRTNRIMGLLLLHGEWDLNHHHYPIVPWVYLPELSPPDTPRVPYWRQYWSQWRGPRPCHEPAPESVGEVQLRLWEEEGAVSPEVVP